MVLLSLFKPLLIICLRLEYLPLSIYLSLVGHEYFPQDITLMSTSKPDRFFQILALIILIVDILYKFTLVII